MTSKLKTIFSKGSKTKPDSDPKPSYTKLQDSSDSTISVQSSNAEEARRKAWDDKRAKEAEDYLWKTGFRLGNNDKGDEPLAGSWDCR
ncbi:hypothetical protein VSDG_02878 [Cytospora chrysosperma]|uniref:Uncharacterized protein n=1 Tax=Cytospora chrysosperma TaxID=252740 RepID=A0A423WC01_CYTCH|nr:hypothetical protein VSDG_02878 [Valsa sordida]